MALAMVWYSILYCLEYDTKTGSSTKHITSIQADGTTAPTTGFRGSTDCYLDFITIPRLVTTATHIVIKLVKFYKKMCFPAARWMAPSLHLIATVEQSLVGLPLPPPINRSFVSFFVSFISSHLFCLPAEVVPFTVGVRFDNDDGQDTPYGVALSYQQLPC